MDEHRQNVDTNEEKQSSQKSAWDIRPYLAVGLTTILVVVICIAIFFVIFRFQGLAQGVGTVVRSLQAVWIGFVLAYLLNPVMKFFERILNKRMYGGKTEKTLKQKRTIRGISVAIAMVIFFAVIAFLIRLILPQLIASIEDIVMSMSTQVQNVIGWLQGLSHSDGVFATHLQYFISEASGYLEQWLRETFLKESSDWIVSVTTGVYNVVRTLFNVIVGIIISVYVLMTKETFIGQLKKIIYAIFRPRWGNVVVEVVRKADDIFGGFFIGKIIDSIIIGFICFAGLTILNLPYPALVSVIVGVTNVIPFFGPYIGAIPCFILIFLVSPIQGLYFLIFIVILQQVDGNIIGPKILGNSTGLSPFWVIFAVLLFGGAFGVLGMLFGVPIFALIYYVIKRVVEHILRIRKLPDHTTKYVQLDKVDVESNTVKDFTGERPIFRREILNLNKKGKKK